MHKLISLDPPWLRVDTGDPVLDSELAGYRRDPRSPPTAPSSTRWPHDRTPVHAELDAAAAPGAARRHRRARRRVALRPDPGRAPPRGRARPAAGARLRGVAPATPRSTCSRATRPASAISASSAAASGSTTCRRSCDEIARRSEFLTPVWGTPSSDHGRNQAWFEFASQLGELIGMEFVGLPVYSWGCAEGHAIRMAARLTGRSHVLVPATMSPERLAVIRTYCGSPELAGPRRGRARRP